MRTAIQLYTLRDRDEQTLGLLSRVAETSFDGVEFAGVPEPGTSIGLRTSGLDVAGAHVGMETLDADVDDVVAACDRVDCEYVVVPYLDESAFETPAAIDETAGRLARLADRLAEDDLALCYHNHDHEFVDVEGTTAFDRLVDATPASVRFEVDVGWALAAGVDPVSLLDRLAGRVPLVHVKDVDAATRTPVELGDGDLDATACAAAARRAGAAWLVYEHDDPVDPLDSLAHGASVLDELRAVDGDVGERPDDTGGDESPPRTSDEGGDDDADDEVQDAGTDGAAWWDDAAR